jgi:hypothetical protein
MAAKVIPISTENFYAACPECGSQEWLLPVNGPRMAWDKIVGSECARCGCLIKWIIVATKEHQITSPEGRGIWRKAMLFRGKFRKARSYLKKAMAILR